MGSERIAQRYRVPTTPVQWDVPKKSWITGGSKLHREQAAVIEVSVVGAAIVAPDTTALGIGSKVEVYWNGTKGNIIVRRVARYPGSTDLLLFGVEYADNPSILGTALFEHLVGGRS
ncbi:MAG: hypothetical protein U0P45_14150 [Acidimicrobiales bacterium]